jgi:protein-tyrosine phosphatase
MKEAIPFHILFVCSGNSCRSPIAEGLLREKLPQKIYGREIIISSAGTLGINGMPAADHAQTVVAEHLGDLTGHRSQGLRRQIVAGADLILVMSKNHMEYFEDRYPQFLTKVHPLRSFANPDPPEDAGIADPIGCDLKTYRECAQIINDELERILPALKKLIEETKG